MNEKLQVYRCDNCYHKCIVSPNQCLTNLQSLPLPNCCPFGESKCNFKMILEFSDFWRDQDRNKGIRKLHEGIKLLEGV